MSNVVCLSGNLTGDPDIRYTGDGQPSASFGLAVNRRWQDRETRRWEEATSFFDVVCWRELAENAALSLARGMRVVVSGRLEQRTWETEGGERRARIEVVADEIGPSLRFATAEVQRVERRAHEGDPTPDAAPAPADV
jgi:single-strand DNA-binding protein